MSVNADDLPEPVRRKLGLTGKVRTKSRLSRAGTSTNVPNPGHCGGRADEPCGQPFPSAKSWEEHARATDHRVWQIDIEALR